MSRINQPTVVDGDLIDAASLNDRFNAYTQTDLNTFNVRDAAIDLPQFDSTRFIVTHIQSEGIGLNDWRHGSVITVTGQTAMPASPYIVGDGAPTVMDFGAVGLTVSIGEVLRIYWNLSVRPYWEGSRPWIGAGALDFYVFDDGASSIQNVATGVSCWVFYLEWDITDNTLTNFVPVPDQADYKTNFAGVLYGDKLEDCMAASVVPAWIERAENPLNGTLPNASVNNPVGWRGISGTYYHNSVLSNRTIFGLRLVFKGVMHSYNTGGANYLVHSTVPSTDARLDYNGGNLSVVKQRIS